MKQIVNSFKIHLLNIKYNKIYIILGVLLLLFSQYINYYFFMLDKNKLYSTLNGQSYLIATFTLYFMINGYLLGKIEIVNKCKEIINYIPNASIKNLVGKLLIGFCLSILVSLIINFPLIIIYFKNSNFLFNQILPFVINYHFAPMIIGFILGIFIGENVRGNKSYLFIFITWFIFTPLNQEFFRILANMLNTNSVNFFRWIFTIGAFTQNIDIYNSITGIYIDPSVIIKNFITFLLLLSLLFIKYARKKVILLIDTLLIISYIFILLIFTNNIEVDIYKNKMQYAYSEINRINEIPKNNFDYIINDIDLNISLGTKANFNAKITINNIKNREISFYLHPWFYIDNIKNSNGEEMKFTRENDVITIILDNINDSIIEVNYSSYSKYGMYLNSNNLFIPSYINYIPSNRNGFCDKNKINYAINVDTQNTVYSNLKVDNGLISGSSSSGVTLISTNELTKINLNNTNLYYSKTLYDDSIIQDKFIEIMNSIEYSNSIIKELFNEQIKIPKDIFIINIHLLPDINIINDNLLLIQQYQDVHNKEIFLQSLLLGHVKNNYQNNNTNNTFVKDIFLKLVNDYTLKKENPSYKTNKIGNSYSSYPEFQRIENLVDSLSINQLKDFINNYYKLITDGVNREKINELINEYEGMIKNE